MTTTQSKGQLVLKRKDEIASIEGDIKKMLPPTIPSDKFIRTVQTALTLNPDLAEADKNSVLTSCMKAAADGLVLDGREAALVTFNKKQKDGSWKKQAQYMPMVAGIVKRVRNSGEVSYLAAHIRHKNDTWKRSLGLDPNLIHEPDDDNPGEAVGVYAVCKFKDGSVDYEYMSKAEVEAIRKRSKSATSGPWVTDWEEMAKKTVIRRLSKRLPVDSDVSRVVERVDEDYDFQKEADPADVPQDEAVTIEHEEKKPAAKKRTGAAAKLNPKTEEPNITDVEPEPVEDEEEMPTHMTDGPDDGDAATSEDMDDII